MRLPDTRGTPEPMSQSLQDQLLKAGLISKDRANKAKKEKHQNRPKGKKAPPPSESQRLAREAAERDAARARQINLQRAADGRKRDLAAQVDQLIREHKLDRKGGEIAYKFTQGAAIRQIMVTQALQEKIVSGQLAIVSLNDRYELVPQQVAERIEERVAGTVILLNPRQAQATDAEDPYADYKVPDDLMW